MTSPPRTSNSPRGGARTASVGRNLGVPTSTLGCGHRCWWHSAPGALTQRASICLTGVWKPAAPSFQLLRLGQQRLHVRCRTCTRPAAPGASRRIRYPLCSSSSPSRFIIPPPSLVRHSATASTAQSFLPTSTFSTPESVLVQLDPAPVSSGLGSTLLFSIAKPLTAGQSPSQRHLLLPPSGPQKT